ncbi:hypothetical protein FH972_025319 [Carpinus fangiana]|uniref:Uncharacterized protein n=1 Tax=Carpinus fangiana TaxID=176857 RepID=A0A5N6L0P1_9ROSI|nr:hypothetical protein FH972_025319 [Carpinus fangiana]
MTNPACIFTTGVKGVMQPASSMLGLGKRKGKDLLRRRRRRVSPRGFLNPEKKGTSSYTRNCYVQFPTATHTLAISLEESSSPFIRHSTHSGTPEHCSFGLSIPVAALFSSTSPLQLTAYADAALLRKGRLP